MHSNFTSLHTLYHLVLSLCLNPIEHLQSLSLSIFYPKFYLSVFPSIYYFLSYISYINLLTSSLASLSLSFHILPLHFLTSLFFFLLPICLILSSLTIYLTKLLQRIVGEVADFKLKSRDQGCVSNKPAWCRQCTWSPY